MRTIALVRGVASMSVTAVDSTSVVTNFFRLLERECLVSFNGGYRCLWLAYVIRWGVPSRVLLECAWIFALGVAAGRPWPRVWTGSLQMHQIQWRSELRGRGISSWLWNRKEDSPGGSRHQDHWLQGFRCHDWLGCTIFLETAWNGVLSQGMASM